MSVLHATKRRCIPNVLLQIFISLEHEKDCCGLNSPGPGTAHRIPSVGRQMVSKAKSAPIWSFGSGKRAPLASSDGPGPGEYYA